MQPLAEVKELVRRIHEAEIPSLAAYGVLQPQLELVVRTALCRDRARRYPTVEALCAALRGAVAPGEIATPAQLAALTRARCAREVAELDQLYDANADTVARSRDSLPASLLAAVNALVERDAAPTRPRVAPAAADERVGTVPDRPAALATIPDGPRVAPATVVAPPPRPPRASTIRIAIPPVATAPVIPCPTVPAIPIATVPVLPRSPAPSPVDAVPARAPAARPTPPRPTAMLRLSQRLTLRHVPTAPRPARPHVHLVARAAIAALLIGLGLYAIDAAAATPRPTSGAVGAPTAPR